MACWFYLKDVKRGLITFADSFFLPEGKSSKHKDRQREGKKLIKCVFN